MESKAKNPLDALVGGTYKGFGLSRVEDDGGGSAIADIFRGLREASAFAARRHDAAIAASRRAAEHRDRAERYRDLLGRAVAKLQELKERADGLMMMKDGAERKNGFSSFPKGVSLAVDVELTSISNDAAPYIRAEGLIP